MKIRMCFFALLILCFFIPVQAQVEIKLDLSSTPVPISPYIFGRNNSLSNFSFGSISDADKIRIQDANVRILRENGGNNSTKYNWRLKLQSHPDWYNNVYANDWGQQALYTQNNFQGTQILLAFQLIGKAAKTNQYNFNDWGYNGSRWWEGVQQNLAGNGVLNNSGTKAKIDGDINLYLQDWNADSTTGILPYFFNDLGIKKENVMYWNMDNEPEIWSSTHDDVVKSMSAEEFVQKYIAVAKKARSLYPNIKLLGPSPANEWQWYNWNNDAIDYKGARYTWMEYFIKRIAEEQLASGIRMVDLIDIHFYPGASADAQVTQLHRVLFDRNYVFPEANGIRRLHGGWDVSINKEYIFGRIQDWLDLYMGKGHGVTLGMTEVGINTNNPNTTAVWYASMLGEFMKNGVELFTPWDWKVGMWEVMHLFSNYSQSGYITSTSNDSENVYSYATANKNKDSISVFLINRSSISKNIVVQIGNTRKYQVNTYALSGLPSSETFINKNQNALRKNDLGINTNSFEITIPAMSILNARLIANELTAAKDITSLNNISIFPNPSKNYFTIQSRIPVNSLEIYSMHGNLMKRINTLNDSEVIVHHHLPQGLYTIKFFTQKGINTNKFLVHP